MLSNIVCGFPGCERYCRTKGYCGTHYQQMRTGRKLSPINSPRKKGTPPRIICDEVPCQNPDLDGPCHAYRGKKTKAGYAHVLGCNGKMVFAHRYCWEKEVGTIPNGLVVDHMCRNRACCNVDHLRVVTLGVNATENAVGSAWQLQSAKTHCPAGHEYSPENTFREKDGSRKCRTCRLNNSRKNYLKRKGGKPC